MQSREVLMIRGTLLLHASSKGRKYLSASMKPPGLACLHSQGTNQGKEGEKEGEGTTTERERLKNTLQKCHNLITNHRPTKRMC